MVKVKLRGGYTMEMFDREDDGLSVVWKYLLYRHNLIIGTIYTNNSKGKHCHAFVNGNCYNARNLFELFYKIS